MSQETLQQKLPVWHISLEGYISTQSTEFLDKLKAVLAAHNLDAADMVFSGFDGSAAQKGGGVPKHPAIFVMNEAGWLDALRVDDDSPARYAEEQPVPCLGVYTKRLLREAYAYELDDHGNPFAERLEFKDIIPGRNLADTGPGEVINSAVVHVDYPEGSPTDALQALVIIDP